MCSVSIFVDINECLEEDEDMGIDNMCNNVNTTMETVESECINTFGGHECECPEGYYLDLDYTCSGKRLLRPNTPTPFLAPSPREFAFSLQPLFSTLTAFHTLKSLKITKIEGKDAL